MTQKSQTFSADQPNSSSSASNPPRTLRLSRYASSVLAQRRALKAEVGGRVTYQQAFEQIVGEHRYLHAQSLELTAIRKTWWYRVSSFFRFV